MDRPTPAPKPKHLCPEYGEQFSDRSVAAAYRFRPSYPDELFEMLVSLVGTPRYVLDAGCGTGLVARPLARYVDRIDAVDISAAMIEEGKRLPGGENPRIRWLLGGMEVAPIEPPYALVTAGASLHWMEWDVVLPLFARGLMPGAYLAIADVSTLPNPWDAQVQQAIDIHSTNRDYQPTKLLDELQSRRLFKLVGQRSTNPCPFVQPIEHYIESFHARNGFSRQRMTLEAAAAFDEEVRRAVTPHAENGLLTLHTRIHIIWGHPLSPSA